MSNQCVTIVPNHSDSYRCALMIHWDIEVTMEGEITPKIELVTKMPENGEMLPFHGLSTSVMFQSLLRVAGVEASIESIINTV